MSSVGAEAVDLEPVKAFLQHALQAQCRGDGSQYNVIVQQFQQRDDPETLWRVILGLNSFVSLITQRSDIFRDLLSAIFSYDWRAELRITEALLSLITQLVSCNALFLTSAFSLFAQSFLPRSLALSHTTTPLNAATQQQLSQQQAESEAERERELALQRESRALVHSSIQSILRQSPTGQGVLLTTLHTHFPHKRFPKQVLCEYVSQLLCVCEYLPALQLRVLDLVVQRCLEMDVEIVVEEGGDVRIQRDLDSDEVDDNIEENDVFATHNNTHTNTQRVSTHTQAHTHTHTGAEGDAHTQPRIPAEVAEMADKLDALLMLLVAFFQKQLNTQNPNNTALLAALLRQESSSSSSSTSKSTSSSRHLAHSAMDNHVHGNSSERLFFHLLKIFESRLLVAHKSKFVQFIMFFVTTRAPWFGEYLARRLFALGTDTQQSKLTRQAAIMYLASFLSRARFLSLSLVHEIVSGLIMFSTAYVLSVCAETRVVSSVLRERLQREFSGTLNERESQRMDVHQQQLLATLADKHSSLFVQQVEYDEYGRLRVKEHSARQHEVLYAAVQSACYVLCFYGTELACEQCSGLAVAPSHSHTQTHTHQQTHNSHKAHTQPTEATLRECWSVVFTSRLDPLRYTLRSVRNEFLKLALHCALFTEPDWAALPADLLVVESEFSSQPVSLVPLVHTHAQTQALTQTQKDNDVLTVCTGVTTAATMSTTYSTTHTQAHTQTRVPIRTQLGPNTLESFFPFDPCLLRSLHTVIETQYRSWRGVPGLEEQQLLALALCEAERDTESVCEDGERDPFAPGRVRSRDMPIPGSSRANGNEEESGSGSAVSSLAMSVCLSHASSYAHSHMQTAGSSSYRERASSLHSLRESVAAAQRERERERDRERAREKERARECGEVEPATDDDEEEEDDEEEDEENEGESEEVFAQGLEISPFGLVAKGQPNRGSYFAQFSAMQDAQNAQSTTTLTAHSLSALSNGFAVHEKRPRLYSVGSTGSW